MENKITLKDVLHICIDELENLRIPIKEAETCSVVRGVVNNLRECIKAIDSLEQKKQEEEQEPKISILPVESEAESDE